MSVSYPSAASSIRRENATKIFLTLIFLGGLGSFVALTGPSRIMQAITSWTVLDFILLGLSTYRLGHLVSYDRVMEPLRAPFARTVPDPTGAGESVEPHGEGARSAIGQLISCPICTGTWLSAGVVSLMIWFPAIVRFFLWMTAAVALSEILQSVTEALSWSGQLSRARAGALQAGKESRESEIVDKRR